MKQIFFFFRGIQWFFLRKVRKLQYKIDLLVQNRKNLREIALKTHQNMFFLKLNKILQIKR